MAWSPKRGLAQTEALLTAPGSIHETQTTLVDGRLHRVYKNLWPSLREFWLAAVAQYSPDTYIVYEDGRLTYLQVHARAVKVAALLRNTYGVKKGAFRSRLLSDYVIHNTVLTGDRVAICSRNCPEYLVVFWACHLLGAVSVLANAWLPLDPLSHCVAHTKCKIVVLDPERADRLQSVIPKLLQETETTDFLVFDSLGPLRRWKQIHSFEESLRRYPDDGLDILNSAISILPEDNATIIFTSGTTGLPKGVLSTQRQFLTNVLNILAGGFRAALRRGEDFPTKQRTVPQKAILVSVPLFHVTGSTSFSMMATATGMKIVLMRKWDVEEGAPSSLALLLSIHKFTAVRLIKEENVSVAGGVPSMVTDLTLSSLAGHPLEGLLFGGAPAPDSLVRRARDAFPSATMLQDTAYGLTETNSIAVSRRAKFAGEDYIARPTSTGRASPVNDIKIVHDDTCLPPGTVGEVWLRGPNVMKEYWGEPEATNAVITKDGWLRTGDVGYLDHEGFLYIKDRLKDIIIRGGENIDSVSVENALYADPRVLEAAAVGVPDERLGELVAAIVSIRPADQGQVTEETLIEQTRSRFAVPVMIIILNTAFKLIAESIETKTTLEVCLYIDILQKAAAKKNGHNVNPGIRDILEPALEVSERWVEHEEEIAQQLMEIDACPCSVGNRSRALSRCTCTSNVPLHGDKDIDTDNTSRKRLNHLTAIHLKALEGITDEVQSKTTQNDIPEVPSAPSQAPGDIPSMLDVYSGPQASSSLPPLAHGSDAAEIDLWKQHRLQKILYYRRKRAQEAAKKARQSKTKKRKNPKEDRESAVPASTRDVLADQSPHTDHDGLTTGAEVVDTNMEGSIESSEVVDEDDTAKTSKKTQAFLKDNVDAEVLSSLGLDLFHLSTLGRLLRLFQSINGSTCSVDSVSISTKSIQLLGAITKDFVSEINKYNVQECLDTMGLSTYNKRKYCAELFDRVEGEKEVPGEEEDDLAMAVEPVQYIQMTQSKVHSRFTLPESLLWCALPSHRDVLSADDIVLLEVDKAALSRELEEDGQLDKKDMAASKQYEDSLWANGVLDIL
ncbi:hypothetical protein NLJ89_g878 [Agrocybe chaxingu]|uniref:Uncharacterized protein n=1 Tax=Agrocybe chaxingu TaxID=84603 RepID=A0A9W8N167_9AGAR|nr:hypothetical protein NLJ89_g878 [Agrocybe chaxingu]